ncbi:MAG: hypothetical protein MJ232_06470, partial [archaeon]|nr:hypothetical protein [archaeon]
FPVILWTVGIYLAAIYLIIVSIYVVVVCSKTIHNANKAKKAGIKVEADVVSLGIFSFWFIVFWWLVVFR